MGTLKALAVALLLTAPLVATAVAQPTPGPGVVGETVDEVYTTVSPTAENETGEDITSEEISLTVALDIRNAEFDLFGVLFGGGKAETDIQAHVVLAFRAVSVERLEPVVDRMTGETGANVTETLGLNTSRMVITAEEVRTLAGGALLEAFQGYQEEAAEARLESTVPGVTVLSTRFEWHNTVPAERVRDEQDPDLREPPLILDATVQLRFIDRFSILDIAEAAGGNETDETKTLQERIEENQTQPLAQRDAFSVLGISQLVSMDIPPGWRLNLTVDVPKGYTIAGATDALVVSEDMQTATYYLDGADRSEALATSGVVTLSDRSLVTMTLAGATVLIGLFLRMPVELAAFWLHRRWAS